MINGVPNIKRLSIILSSLLLMGRFKIYDVVSAVGEVVDNLARGVL